MSEQLVPVLAGVLQMKPEEITEKLKSPEGVAELETATKGLKVFKSNDEYTQTLNTYRQSNMQIWKDELYKEHKTNVHAALEKQIKEDFPELAPLEYKKDYQNTTDLIKKAVSIANKKTGNKDEWEAEKTQLQKLISDYKTQLETSTKDIESKYKNRLVNKELSTAIELISPQFDVEDDKRDSQKAFLKFLIQQSGVTIHETSDEQFVLKDKDNNPILDDSGKPKSISAYVSELAVKNIPMKENVPAGGRGVTNPSTKNRGMAGMLEFTNFDDYLQSERNRGNNITIGSKESNEAYALWLKAHGKE